MRSVGFALIGVVALCVAGIGANADTVDPSAGTLAIAATVQAAGQADTAPDADATKASADDPAAEAAVPPEGQAGATEGAEQEKKSYLAVAYLAFMPTDGKTRTNFGKVWGGFGIGLFSPEYPHKQAFSWSISVLPKNGKSDALLIPLTVGVQRGFGQDPDLQSYAAVRVGPYYGKVEDNLQGPDDSKIGGCANVALGLIIDRRFLVEARYDWFTKLAGNNFNGLTLTAAVRVLSFSR
jgi:hypothetical protein